MTKEEHNKRNREYYRKKHPDVKRRHDCPTDKNGFLMTEKVVFPLIVIGGLSTSVEKMVRAEVEGKRSAVYQKLLRQRWERDKMPQSIIIVEAGSMPAKKTTTYTAECYLKTPYTDELRNYWKNIVKEIIIEIEEDE